MANIHCMGLDSVELVMAWEEDFEISITDEEAEKIETVGRAVDLIFAKLQEKPAKSAIDIVLDRERVREMVVDIIVDQLGVRPEQCTDEAYFVRDLGVD